MQQLIAFLGAWQNMPFTLMLVLCVVLALLQLVGLGGEPHEADSETDVDHDLDHDHDVDHDHDADHDGGQPDHIDDAPFSLLAFLGIGKAPLMVVLLMLFAAVGLIGWSLNALVQSAFGHYPGLAFAGVLPVALLGGAFVCSRLARAFGRILPPIATSAEPARALVGRRGTVITAAEPGRIATVRVRDAGGNMISVYARLAEGQPASREEDVVLVRYDDKEKVYEVTRTRDH